MRVSFTAGPEQDSEEPVEYYCGVGRFRPSWLQRLRDVRLLVFFLCCNTFIQGALVSGMYIACQSYYYLSVSGNDLSSRHKKLYLWPLFV